MPAMTEAFVSPVPKSRREPSLRRRLLYKLVEGYFLGDFVFLVAPGVFENVLHDLEFSKTGYARDIGPVAWHPKPVLFRSSKPGESLFVVIVGGHV